MYLHTSTASAVDALTSASSSPHRRAVAALAEPSMSITMRFVITRSWQDPDLSAPRGARPAARGFTARSQGSLDHLPGARRSVASHVLEAQEIGRAHV